jgi:hypothetical protein
VARCVVARWDDGEVGWVANGVCPFHSAHTPSSFITAWPQMFGDSLALVPSGRAAAAI